MNQLLFVWLQYKGNFLFLWRVCCSKLADSSSKRKALLDINYLSYNVTSHKTHKHCFALIARQNLLMPCNYARCISSKRSNHYKKHWKRWLNPFRGSSSVHEKICNSLKNSPYKSFLLLLEVLIQTWNTTTPWLWLRPMSNNY